MMRNKRILLLCSLLLSSVCLASEKAHELYDRGVTEESASNPLNDLRDMANKGDADAQNLLGWEYYKPRYDTTPDIQEAVKWFTLAAGQEKSGALLALGQIYYSGEQVRVNYEKAWTYFNKAARYGEKEAWSNLGLMYANGQYVAADCTKAKEYLEKGVRIQSGPKDLLSACRKDLIDREKIGDTLPSLTVSWSDMRNNFINEHFSCANSFFVSTSTLGEIANLRLTLGIKNPSGKEIFQTLGFAPFGMNRLNISFTDYLQGSLSSEARLLVYKPEFCSRVKFRITAATATINGKDIDVLKAGILTLKP